MNVATRTEHDLIGEREVPLDAYWGIHTLRALENFPITGHPDRRESVPRRGARRGQGGGRHHQPRARPARRRALRRDPHRVRGDPLAARCTTSSSST